MENRAKMLSGLFIGLGLVVAGWLLGSAIENFKAADRVVSVRGLAEREVKADRVIWPLVYTQTGNDLVSVYNALEAKNKIVVEYLMAGGLGRDEISIAPPAVVDMDADQYSNVKKAFRYIVTQVITITSDKVDQVIALRADQTALLRREIALSNNAYQYQTQFLFTKLNDVKPSMIEEATKNARTSAEKFAEDSGSELGKIKSATQGQFSIENRDEYTPQLKNVRVVTYVEYTLKN